MMYSYPSPQLFCNCWDFVIISPLLCWVFFDLSVRGSCSDCHYYCLFVWASPQLPGKLCFLVVMHHPWLLQSFCPPLPQWYLKLGWQSIAIGVLSGLSTLQSLIVYMLASHGFLCYTQSVCYMWKFHLLELRDALIFPLPSLPLGSFLVAEVELYMCHLGLGISQILVLYIWAVVELCNSLYMLQK